jgi:hypothetical protein
MTKATVLDRRAVRKKKSWSIYRPARSQSSPSAAPVVKTRIDHDRNAAERYGDEAPAQRVEAWKQRQDDRSSFGKDVLRARGRCA